MDGIGLGLGSSLVFGSGTGCGILEWVCVLGGLVGVVIGLPIFCKLYTIFFQFATFFIAKGCKPTGINRKFAIKRLQTVATFFIANLFSTIFSSKFSFPSIH